MKNATDIVIILDKSGSMLTIKDDVIGGFNSFLEEQKKQPGECNLTMALFDSTYEIRPSCPISDMKPLTDKTYTPGGWTALFDAVGRAVYETGKRLAALDESQRPDKVMVVVITDGHENASVEYKLAAVREMVEHQQTKYSWKFMFLGANIDSFAEAGQIGISCAYNFRQTSEGTDSMYRGLSAACSSYRERGDIGRDWKDLIDKDKKE